MECEVRYNEINTSRMYNVQLHVSEYVRWIW